MIDLKCGDCFEEMIELIDKNVQVDAIIIDPPYCICQAEWDKQFDMKKAVELSNQLLKINGNFIIFQGWSNVCDTIQIFKEEYPEYILQDWIIYDRIKGRGGKRHLVSTREDILWYSKGDKYTFNKIPSTIKKKTGGLGMKNGCEYRALSNVWTDISPIVPWSKERVKHPTQKPLKLMERCVKLWTNENETVLDFTMGSGSTGVACTNMGRNFIGIELNNSYFEIACNRINQVQNEHKKEKVNDK